MIVGDRLPLNYFLVTLYLISLQPCRAMEVESEVPKLYDYLKENEREAFKQTVGEKVWAQVDKEIKESKGPERTLFFIAYKKDSQEHAFISVTIKRGKIVNSKREEALTILLSHIRKGYGQFFDANNPTILQKFVEAYLYLYRLNKHEERISKGFAYRYAKNYKEHKPEWQKIAIANPPAISSLLLLKITYKRKLKRKSQDLNPLFVYMQVKPFPIRNPFWGIDNAIVTIIYIFLRTCAAFQAGGKMSTFAELFRTFVSSLATTQIGWFIVGLLIEVSAHPKQQSYYVIRRYILIITCLLLLSLCTWLCDTVFKAIGRPLPRLPLGLERWGPHSLFFGIIYKILWHTGLRVVTDGAFKQVDAFLKNRVTSNKTNKRVYILFSSPVPPPSSSSPPPILRHAPSKRARKGRA